MKTIKTLVLGLTTLAIAGASVQTAAAGDREWATAGKVLTGIAAASLLARALEAPPAYTYQQTAYAPPPGYVVQSAPVVVYEQPVYVQPSPVVVYQYPPSPVYVRPARVYYARPGMVVERGFGYGHRHGHASAYFCR